MPKGPILGAPRPFAEYRLLINPHKAEALLYKVGPFGGPRPFAKNNPPVSQDRINQCVISESGRKFGAGVVSDGRTNDFQDLAPAEKKKALDLAEKWCTGSLEATKMDEMERGEATEVLNTVKEELNRMTGTAGENIEIELLD